MSILSQILDLVWRSEPNLRVKCSPTILSPELARREMSLLITKYLEDRGVWFWDLSDVYDVTLVDYKQSPEDFGMSCIMAIFFREKLAQVTIPRAALLLSIDDFGRLYLKPCLPKLLGVI